MSGLFAYARVAPASTPTTAGELRKAAALAGHAVLPDNTVIEVVTRPVALSTRSGWRKLLDRMYEGDTLVVPTLGDLGGDAKEICATVKQMARLRLRVHCLGIGSGRVDLAGSAGRPMMEMLIAVAALEQERQIERDPLTKSASQALLPTPPKGRPPSLSLAQMAEARQLLAMGSNVAQIARRLRTSRQTIMRLRARVNA
jgi:putative DNA-invertase from lambdoid prophage Rac